MISQDQVLGQAVVGGVTVHLLQFFNVPKQLCPYISGAVAFLSGIGLTLSFQGNLASGGSACFGYPSATVLMTAIGASVLQWIAQEGWYQKFAKPIAPVVVTNTTVVQVPKVGIVAPVVKP